MSTGESKSKVRGPLDVIADALESIVISISSMEVRLTEAFDARLKPLETDVADIKVRLAAVEKRIAHLPPT